MPSAYAANKPRCQCAGNELLRDCRNGEPCIQDANENMLHDCTRYSPAQPTAGLSATRLQQQVLPQHCSKLGALGGLPLPCMPCPSSSFLISNSLRQQLMTALRVFRFSAHCCNVNLLAGHVAD